MNRKYTILLLMVAAFSALTTFMFLRAFPPETILATDVHGDTEQTESESGPNGGRLLRNGNLAVEIVIAESGIAPEFHVYAFDNDLPLMPDDFKVEIELGRLGGIRDTFTFVVEDEYLRGIEEVREPHSFDVTVTATYAGRAQEWHYDSFEGRTSIPQRVADASGIRTEAAGPQQILEVIELTGTVQTNPARVSEVRARFSGVVTDVLKDSGERVARGETLARVETNESLRSVSIEAPISGVIVNRNIQVGQVTGTEPLFVIADLSEVWVQLDVFGRDLSSVAAGQQTIITSLDGNNFDGIIDWVSPLVAHASQSVRARIPLQNPDGALRAGQFVRARVTVSEADVPLTVRRSALQTFRDFDVVYARVGNIYEVRMLQLGRRDAEFVEVLGGLENGEIYVTENSYLVKADIEKSGATHDH
jgi:cobalt-zinc-cadmium efflux system membrane fusion protein